MHDFYFFVENVHQEASDARKWRLSQLQIQNFSGAPPLDPGILLWLLSAKRRRASARPNEALAPHWDKNSQYSLVPFITFSEHLINYAQTH